MKLKNWGIHFPFSPAKFPFFYGYFIIFLGVIGLIMSAPGQTIGVSAFTESLLKDYGISRDNFTWAYMIGTISSGFLITSVGRFYDRYGVRIIAIMAALMLGMALFYLTKVPVFAPKIQLFGLSQITVITIFFAFGIFAIRFFGQGVLTMVSRNMVMKWFDQRRGMANIFLSGISMFGFSFAPVFFSNVIEMYGWHYAWHISALILAVPFVLVVMLLFRDNPQQCGLIPDGKKIEKRNKNLPPSHPVIDYTLKEARKTFSFWIYTLALVMHGLFITGFSINVESIFQELSLSDPFNIFPPVALVSIISSLGFSYLSDYVRLKYILLSYISFLLMSMISLYFLGNHTIFYCLFIAGMGLSAGQFSLLMSIVWPRFFGTKHLGAISGFAMSILVIATGMGPKLFSLSKSYYGNYNVATILCFSATFVLLLLAFKAKNVNV